MMIFVFSIGLLRKYMPRKEVILVLVVSFLIGAIGGAFFLEPIYQEMPSMVNVVEKNMPNVDETLYLDFPSTVDLNDLSQNLSGTPGFRSYTEESFTVPLWKFSDNELSYFNYVIKNIDPHYKNYTVNESGSITIEIGDNYTVAQGLKSFSDWYKLVYGRSIAYANIHAKLVIESSSFDQFEHNLMDRGIVASKLEGPVQKDYNSTGNQTLTGPQFVLVTGVVGVIVGVIGIYFDSVVVYYRRLKKFLETKRKR